MTVEGSNLKISNIIVYIVTGLSFALFTAYQVFLAVQIPEQRAGRIIGIVFYVFLTAASFLALIRIPVLRITRSVLLLAGLLLLFAMRLFSASAVFGSLDFANTPSVLYCAVYVFSQLGTFILAFYYLLFRRNKINRKRKLIAALMSIVIVLYVSVLVMECVLILKYRVNIDLSVKFTVLSRILYCLGFAGTAVGFMLPVQEPAAPEDMLNQAMDEGDLVFSNSENANPDKNDVMINPVQAEIDKDFVL